MSSVFYNEPLNIIIKSFTDVGGFIFPLSVDIKNIVHNNDAVYFIKIDMSSKPEDDIFHFGYEESPFKEQYHMLRYETELRFIYDFIDWDLLDFKHGTFREMLKIKTPMEFVEWFMDSGLFTVEDIITMGNEIRNYINLVKSKFTEEASKLFGLRDEFPEIKLKDDGFSTPAEYLEYMFYNYNMLSFQASAELPMGVWFPENVGRGYTEYSWREQEAKRIYLSAKNKIETFKETVKAKQIEDMKDS